MNPFRKTMAFALAAMFLMFSNRVEATPLVYYVNLGDAAQLQCGGGSFVCFSTYAHKTQAFAMVPLTPSYKYQIQSGFAVINNIQATDAGFYTCAARCDQVTYEQISYYLHPTMSGVPIDTNQNWIAIPPQSFDDNTRQRYYVVVNEEGHFQGHNSGLSVGEIIGLVVGVALAVLITLAIIIVLCILNKRRKKRNQEKIISSGRKDEKDTSSVDYSTIERDYASSAGNTLTSSRDQHQLAADRDGELNSLAANKARTNEINTRGISGPGLYRPNDYNTGSNRSGVAMDLPNIDIGGFQDKKTASNRSQNRVQFPDRPNVDNRPRYVSNENIHLEQIPQDPCLLPNMLEDEYDQNHPYQFSNRNLSAEEPENESGGVTVVSARTPARLDQQLKQQQQQQPPPQQPPRAYINQNQPPPPKQYPGLSLSHRIETTSTPLQIPMSSSSVRNGANNQFLSNATPLRQASLNKDGATDV